MDHDPRADIELLRTELRQGRRVRSSLGAWMFRNHLAFAALLAEEGVDWERLAAGFARLGLTDATHKPPRAGTAKLTWRRVQAALERDGVAVKRRRSGNGKRSRAAVTPGAAAAPSAAEPGTAALASDPAAAGRRFKPARRRAPAAPQAMTPAEQADLHALRARVFGTEEGKADG